MAACTSRAAASMLRLRSNCRVMPVAPRALVEVISVMPAMRPNWRSRGVATEEAMVSGLAPGREALTAMVGNSTWGSGDTGRNLKARIPARATAMVSSEVAMGRWMKGVDRLMGFRPAQARPRARPGPGPGPGTGAWPRGRSTR